MTREEIIRNLKYTMEKHKNDIVPTFGTNISLMCKDILDYLEQEPCDDCISRQAVLDMATTIQTDDFGGNEVIEVVAVDDIKNMPHVTPTIERGKWIPVSERLPEEADCYEVTRQIGDELMVDACYFDGINTWHDDHWINDERNYVTDIVAWMPNPEPYKESE